MNIEVTITFTLQRASNRVCEKFQRPLGELELLDADGCRMMWPINKQHAMDNIQEWMNAAGYVNCRIAEAPAEITCGACTVAIGAHTMKPGCKQYF